MTSRQLLKVLGRIVVAAALILIIGICVVGFLATLEPMSAATRWSWRAVYTAVGGSCVVALAWLIVSRRARGG